MIQIYIWSMLLSATFLAYDINKDDQQFYTVDKWACMLIALIPLLNTLYIIERLIEMFNYE